MTIRAECFTNLDDFRLAEWPTEFVALPRVGDYVEAIDGKRLRVVAITHSAPRDRCGDVRATVRLELHR